MFDKERLGALFDELNRDWRGTTEFEQLTRDAHLGIAYHDAGRPPAYDIDPGVAALIEKHKPAEQAPSLQTPATDRDFLCPSWPDIISVV